MNQRQDLGIIGLQGGDKGTMGNTKRELEESWESLGISNDFLFGKVMRDPQLCRELLERILPDLEILRIEYPEAQKSIRNDVDAKSVRLDVYVRDDKGTVYDIEMQVADTKEILKRTSINGFK